MTELTVEEQKIIDKFQSVSLKQIPEISRINLSIKTNKLYVSSPKVYEIEDTDSIIILGEPKQVVDYEYFKRLYAQQAKNKKK